ncbi:hypothetical protein LMH66_13890 [Shewanella sp. 10N.7]|uniref:hypothetical protein n=1 Tax=Shewanella sp. 10N.7 TaxID=2885093 RepID=UPI001E2D175C|nr:hypothetical protein [Shewanella sp. 10N.7]MCC4833729.1 hypothetical protein [Shewanella sp. 10N.7]
MGTSNSNTTRRKPLVGLGIVAAIIVLIAVVFSVLPKGFKTSHEDIGSGISAVVFVYDPNLAVSNSQTEQMNEARGALGDDVAFLIARIGTPEGDQFIGKYQARPAEVLLFEPVGKLVKRQYALKSATELVQWVNSLN